MEKKAFVKSIQECRRKLNIAAFLQLWIFALGVGALVGTIFQIVAFCVPFYQANLYSLLAILLGTVCAVAAVMLRRKSMKQAALFMDSFGFQERIITAYEHLEEEGELVLLQRKDAMARLEQHRDKIKVSFMPDWRKCVLTGGMLALMCVLMLLPSDRKEQAKELHLLKQEAKTKEEEIEEVLEGLEELQKYEELTPEQLAELQEMMESLQSSMQEYEQVTSPEALAAANQKLNYKYNNMGEQLGNMASMLQNGAAASPQSQQAMQNMSNQMQQLGGNTAGGNNSLASNQNGNNSGNNGQQNSGQSGNQQGNGQSGNNQNGQNGQNGQSGNSQNNGQNGQGNNQSGGAQGNGQNGQGNGEGSNQGNSQGTGSGSGSGRGEGSGSAPHDYVSIPNEIADSGNLTGNAGNHDNSEYFRAPNGLNWEGTHVSYESVIGSYEQNAYEGIAAGKYPSGMEDVIKDYFASFN